MTQNHWETDNDYLTLEQAAQLLKCRVDFVERLVEQHRLKAFKMGYDWLTTSDWLQEYRRSLQVEFEQAIKHTGDNSRETSPYVLPVVSFFQTPAWKWSVISIGLTLVFSIVLGVIGLVVLDWDLPQINDERLTLGFRTLMSDIWQPNGQVAGISENVCSLDTPGCQIMDY